MIKQSDGKVLGTHDSRPEAEAQMRAIHANEGNRTRPSPGTRHMAKGGLMKLNDSYEPESITEVYVDGRKVQTGK